MKPASAKPSLLIAFGGNALNIPGDHKPRQKEEFVVARKSMEQLVPLLKQGYETMILTHGNGPQVGQIFLQQELTVHEFPRQITLDVCVADSQGRIGYILQNVFDNVCQQHGLDKKSFSVITQVVVDPNDPGFQHPTKPIGVFYKKDEADRLRQEHGWVLNEDAGRGWR
ncbi:MAG: carbamate kinase, partial [Nitrospinaceae bacterium]|nr:carbamate kinase [Nitrospinaceae bacterium]NIR57405.1 carbamate kinase [Nitrospinaceae bacterium]NIS87857.1 carbamate kinase [Nitrospinaceae bacterium]NIT84728.1 carbamate kinase [Nitrospinaceae bacterium]NIU46906.1 carbamate kinase [Nitrospinaceae bacterium]